VFHRNIVPVRFEMVPQMPIRHIKGRVPKHSWSENFPVVFHRMCESLCGRNPVGAGVEFQLGDELQFLPLGFAFRHAVYRPEYFRFTLSFFLTGDIHPILEEILFHALRPVRPLSDGGILPTPARHAFTTLSRWNWRRADATRDSLPLDRAMHAARKFNRWSWRMKQFDGESRGDR